jgi:hypothetical protein
MMKKLLLAASALLASVAVALAVGQWPGLPLLGGASYCAGYSVSNTGNTVPGTLPSGNQCSSTVPAGNSTFNGYEGIPVDTYGFNQDASGSTSVGPQTQMASVLQFDQGVFTNLASTTSATTVTVGCQTSVLFENATVTNPTITFCATPLQGQKFTLVWGANLTTGITTAAGAGSSCLPACGAISGTTAGTTHQWLYNGTIWYQIQ